MFGETDILTATNSARLLYLLATCGGSVVGSWLYQHLFSQTVTWNEIIVSAFAGVLFFLFPVGMMFWNLYFALLGGLLFGFGITSKLEFANEQRDDF